MRIALVDPVLLIYGNYATSMYSSYSSTWYRGYPHDKSCLYIVALIFKKMQWQIRGAAYKREGKMTVIVSVDNVLALVLVW